MLSTLLSSIYNAISAPFTWLEDLFGAFGLSFLILFTFIIICAFVVRKFVSVFF